MREKMETINVPTTANELERLLHRQFKELTGESAKPGKNVFISRYDTGGMSSGTVSCDFWLDWRFRTKRAPFFAPS
jgi:hypothetical protein